MLYISFYTTFREVSRLAHRFYEESVQFAYNTQ